MTRFMLYNIYDGGKKRLDNIAEVVRAERPDFLGMLEAATWNKGGPILKRFAAQVGLPFSHFVKSNTRYDLAFFCGSTPLRIKKFFKGFWHSAVLVELSVESVGTIALVLLHLDPRQEAYRLNELERVRTITARYTHVVLMGDFNSLSPHDPYDRVALMALLRKRGIKKFGIQDLKFDCIELIESFGFVDVMHALQKPFASTVPTLMNTDASHADHLRLDYIFISPSLRTYLTDAVILQTPSTNIASDHYPLVADFTFA